MSCKFDIRLLYSYSDKTIEPLERIFVEEHLKYCRHCQNELRLIKIVDNELKEALCDIEMPEKLSLISQLVAENCIEQLDASEIKGMLGTVKAYASITRESMNAFRNNPYNNFINSSIRYTARGVNKSLGYTAKVLEKPMKRIVSNSLQRSRLFSRFRLG